MSNGIGATEEKVQEICSSPSDLEADSQAERPPRYVLPEAIPGYEANAGDEERLVAANVELDPAAEGKEVVEAEDVVLVPKIVGKRELQHVADRMVERREPPDGRAPSGPQIYVLRQV